MTTILQTPAQAPPPEVASGKHGDVVFVSDTDPFGGYYSGWQTLLVYGLALTATILITRRNGPKAGRMTFYLGLVALGALQIAPYLILLPQMRAYGITLVFQLPLMLAQSVLVTGFWLPVFWLTTLPGKFQQKLPIALAISTVGAAIFSACLRFPASGILDFEILTALTVAAVLGGILFAVHVVYLLAAFWLSRRPKPA
ncbi:hypothetical protein ABAC460_06550 [Asticcacaulis sp. AC460]|uniref:hypothetical protein n=1 Tax=Asticcacaulis sp. AC460 TaxID=1282360 RepID=UPI0003C403DC|nr:hypothetical protein [Asticcacaulis sp. AC460]ESQ91218.1 hypothetical protein ABAC460_06550 [Asticcacaulis sp. AC460]